MGGLICFQQSLPLAGHGGADRGRIYTCPGFICMHKHTHVHPKESLRARPRHPQGSEAGEQRAPMQLRFPSKKPGFPADLSNPLPWLQPTLLSCQGAILP